MQNCKELRDVSQKCLKNSLFRAHPEYQTGTHQGQAQHRLQTVKVLGRKGPVMQCTLQRRFCQKLSLTSSNNDPKNN